MATFAARTNVRDQGFSSSAAGGGRSEDGKLAAVKIARRSKPRKRFWAPQVLSHGFVFYTPLLRTGIRPVFSFFSKVFLGFLRSANMCVPEPYECRDTHNIYPFVFSPTKSCRSSDARINVADTSPTPRHRSHKSNRSNSALLPSRRQGFFHFKEGVLPYANPHIPFT